jgi:hypothetical protein
MIPFLRSRAVKAALIGVAVTGFSTLAYADIRDYEFQLVDRTVKAGPDQTIAVRLVNRTTGKPVPDAVIFASRLDMTPDGMQEMASKLTPISDAESGAEPGTYRFKANVSMAGHWQLSLGAKLQGETGTLQNKLVIEADK